MRIWKKSAGLFTVAAVCLAMCFPVSASDIGSLQEKKKQTGEKKKQAQSVLSRLENEQSDILAAIKQLDDTVAEYNAQIDELETQKLNLNDDIAVKEDELADAKRDEEEQYEAMKRRIQYAYENGDYNYMDTIFTSASVADMVNASEYESQIYNYDAEMLDQLIDIKHDIEDKEVALKDELAEVEEIEEEVEESKEAVEIMIEGKQNQVKNYKASIGEYENVVAQLAAAEAELDRQIEEAERAAREAAERAAAAAAAGTGQPVTIYYTGGTFQWPVSTGGTITSRFGPRWGTIHKGLDIACPTGTPILAGESGTVIGAGYNASMGNYVLIDHGGGVSTVYMHNSELAVSVGQVVSRGQVISYAGSTGDSTGPHCHFGLRVNGEYINPEPYLQ